jgi:hypothetical protein
MEFEYIRRYIYLEALQPYYQDFEYLNDQKRRSRNKPCKIDYIFNSLMVLCIQGIMDY